MIEQGPRDVHAPWALRALFLSCALVMVLLHFVDQRYDEPYPAVMMPDFEGPGQPAARGILVERCEVHLENASGQERVIGLREFLGELPWSLHGKISRTHLHPSVLSAHAPKAGQRSMISRIRSAIFPGYRAGAKARGARNSRREVAGWVRERLDRMGHEDAAVARFVWIRERHRWTGAAGGASERVDSRTYSVDLGDGR